MYEELFWKEKIVSGAACGVLASGLGMGGRMRARRHLVSEIVIGAPSVPA